MAVPTPQVALGPPPSGTDRAFRAPRRGGNTTQRHADYRDHFPVGVHVDMAAPVDLINGDGTTTATQPNNVPGLRAIINHPTQGLKANNLRYLWFNNAGPYFHEVAQNLPGLLEADRGGGELYIAVFGLQLKVTVDAASALDTTFYSNAGAANTLEVATPLAQQVVDELSEHPSILAYHLWDDVTTANRGAKVHTMLRALHGVDPHGRAATAVTDGALIPTYAPDLKIFLFYRYPAGEHADGADTAEGDFHRSTFALVPNLGGGGGDWVDAIREWTNQLPAGVAPWITLQVHKTTTGSTGTLVRYPTDRELRLQFWIAVGEGVKGIFWFLYGNQDVGGGSVEPMLGGRPSTMAVAKELSDRLTPEMRARLLRCSRITTPFTASGGGSTGYPVNYPNAYVSALADPAGPLYCVLCNHATATANVTVSSATLTGAIISLETGARYRLGVDAIALPALDGTVLVYDPEIGVPETVPDYSVDVETWWGTHWANPASSQYRAPGTIPTHPNVVNVAAGANLQAAIDAAPDNTTFVLDHTGTFARCEIIERRGLHFVSSVANDPAQRPTVRGFDILGSRYARHYNPIDDNGTLLPGFQAMLEDKDVPAGADGTPEEIQASKDAWFNPANDLLFRDLDFVSDGSLTYYQKFLNTINSPLWTTNHWYPNAAIGMRCVRDVLIERCSASGYTAAADQSTAAPNDPVQTIAPTGHPGVFWGNAGITNIVIRDTDIALATNAGGFGFPYAVFFDGARGVISENVRVTGKSHSGTYLFLTNDDFTINWKGTVPSLDFGARNARYIVIANGARTWNGGNSLVDATGFDILVTNITITTSALVPGVVIQAARCSRKATAGHVYEHYGLRARDNTITGGNVTSFLTFVTSGGWQCGAITDPAYVYRGLVGKAAITGNSVSGTISKWLQDDTTPAEGPHVISGNNKNDSTGVGI